jgi:hypothetical protein
VAQVDAASKERVSCVVRRNCRRVKREQDCTEPRRVGSIKNGPLLGQQLGGCVDGWEHKTSVTD